MIKNVIEGNVEKLEENISEPYWIDWKYKVKVNLVIDNKSEENLVTENFTKKLIRDDTVDVVDSIGLSSGQNFTLTLNILHMVIILRQYKILKCLLKVHTKPGLMFQYITKNFQDLPKFKKLGFFENHKFLSTWKHQLY